MFEKDPREDERAGPGLSRASRATASVEGIVREALPYAQYRVEIDRGRHVTAHAPGGEGRNFIRILIGDRVRLELAPRDVTRGRIVAVVSR
jgi:translation initiation factor IF-1